jgi:hypothetical protein
MTAVRRTTAVSNHPISDHINQSHDRFQQFPLGEPKELLAHQNTFNSGEKLGTAVCARATAVENRKLRGWQSGLRAFITPPMFEVFVGCDEREPI